MRPTSYDELLYPSHAFSEAHPDRMAAMAALCGLAAPLENLRILEVGCGDGSHVIPMAYSLPGCQVLGIDLAERPIRMGQETVRRLGLANIDLRVMDLMDLPADAGPFDYVIAHGFFSWVPEPVRLKLLAVCRDCLAPGGIAFISYNTYPHGHIREMSRRMMRYHLGRTGKDSTALAEARSFIQTLSGLVAASGGPGKNLLQMESARLAKYQDNVLAHDDLGPVFDCFYFSDFAELASRYGLTFVCESRFRDALGTRAATPDALAAVGRLAGDDSLAFEQYLDFALFNGFRRTLLCRSDNAVPDRTGMSGRLGPLWIASPLRYEGAGSSGSASTTAKFVNTRAEGRLECEDPALIALLKRLESIWPRGETFRALTEGGGGSELADQLLKLAAAQMVDVRTHQLPVAREASPGRKPEASPLARLQAEQGPLVTTLLHLPVNVDQAPARLLLAHLDGTRNLDQLTAVLSGSQPGIPSTELRPYVERTVASFYRLGLMLA